MKVHLFILTAHFLLFSNICLAYPIDLFVRAEAVKSGVALNHPLYKVGEIFIEKGTGGNLGDTYIRRVISVDHDEVKFVESIVNNSNNVEKDAYTVDLVTGHVTSINGRPYDELKDYKVIVRNVEKKDLATSFGEKNCTVLTIDLYKISNNAYFKNIVFIFCDSLPGSGLLYNSWTVLGHGVDLKDYLE